MNTTKATQLVAAIVASLLLAPVMLAASVAQPRGGPDHFRLRHGGRGGPGELRLLRELDLSEEQREQIRAILQDAGARQARERLMEARRALREAVTNGADEGQIRELAYQVGQAEGDAAVERMRLRARIRELLTPEQQQELEELEAERKERMEERRKRFEERMERRRSRNPEPL